MCLLDVEDLDVGRIMSGADLAELRIVEFTAGFLLKHCKEE